MLFQTHHKLIATPDGIFLDDVALHKCALNTFSEQSLHHLLRATELSAEMKKEDWEPPSPKLAEIQIHLALSNPGTLNKITSTLANRAIAAGAGRQSARRS